MAHDEAIKYILTIIYGVARPRPSIYMARGDPARARAGLTFSISPYRPDKTVVKANSKRARPENRTCHDTRPRAFTPDAPCSPRSPGERGVPEFSGAPSARHQTSAHAFTRGKPTNQFPVPSPAFTPGAHVRPEVRANVGIFEFTEARSTQYQTSTF